MNNRIRSLVRFLKNRNFHPVAVSEQDAKRIYAEMLVALRLIARALGLPIGSFIIYGGIHHRCAILKASGFEVKAYIAEGKLVFSIHNKYACGILPAEGLVDFEAFIEKIRPFVPSILDNVRRVS